MNKQENKYYVREKFVLSLYVEERPCGKFEILMEDIGCKKKRITVKPGGRLSYQYHHKRSEVWTIVSGTATITLDELTKDYEYGDTVLIPQGTKHRVENQLDDDLVFIEVQHGSYFGEDDIVRIEDDYMRADDVQDFLERADKQGPWSEEDDKTHTIGGLTMPKENTNKLNNC